MENKGSYRQIDRYSERECVKEREKAQKAATIIFEVLFELFLVGTKDAMKLGRGGKKGVHGDAHREH